jgi:O-antigen/teichoic acid export membrane protein
MGVIRRQTMKYSLVNLAGLMIGAFSTLFIYPHALEANGLVQVLQSVGMIGLPIFALGANTVAIRFFPRFQDKATGHHGFIVLLVGLCCIGFICSGLIIGFFWSDIIHFMQSGAKAGSNLLPTYFWMALPLAFFYVLGVVMGVYSSNFKRIVVPSLLLDFSQKIIVPVLLIAVWQQWISVEMALWGLLLHAALVFTALVFYLRWLKEWHWQPQPQFLDTPLRRELLQFILFGAIGGFALQLASKVDVFMVGSLSSLKAAGIYTIAAYIAAAIDIPTKGLYAASASSVAQYLARDDRPALESLYKKVSINLLVIGVLLFGATWTSVDNLFNIMSNSEEVAAGKYVLLFIGISRLVEMGTGLNNYMMYYSKYFLYALVSLSVLAVANISLNLWLVPRLGITGAAVATLISVASYNFISIGLVWVKFRLQPFTIQTLYTLLSGILAYAIVLFVPKSGYDLLDITYRSGLYVLIFGSLAFYLRLSPDLNEMLRKK